MDIAGLRSSGAAIEAPEELDEGRRAGGDDAPAGEHAPEAHGDDGVAGEKKDGDFFELEPGDVHRWKTREVTLPARLHRDWGPAVKVLALLAAVALIAVALVFLLLPSSNAAPDLRGKTLYSAMERARSMGFKPVVKAWVYSVGNSDGVVIEQKPAPGSKMTKGQEMTLQVSKGPHPEEAGGPRQIPPVSAASSATAPTAPLSGRVVCIDPGHQGKAMSESEEWLDPGLTSREPQEPPGQGVASGNFEQSFTLDIASKLKDLLEKDGVQVVMTRTTDSVDVSNTDRAEIANNAEAQLLVSIHTGDAPLDSTKNGSEMLYPTKTQWTSNIYEKSKTAALLIQPEVVKSTSLNDLGISSTDRLTLFNWSKVPVIQANTGYITNADDDRNLSKDSFRWKVAQGLRNGIIKYLNNR